MINHAQSGHQRTFMSKSEKIRIGIIFDEEKTSKLLEIASSFNKTPEQFINGIIESTYNKIKILESDWEDDE